MDNQLEKARAHYESLHLLEAYHGFRRYFDRLPFKPEEKHAEYIGMFVRCLLELGKNFELEFYLKELEKLYSKSKNPSVGYALAAVYRNSDSPRPESARRILETLLADPQAAKFHNRARLTLAGIFEEKGEFNIARNYVDSVTGELEPQIRRIWILYKGLLLNDEKKHKEALELIYEILKETSPTNDWYSYFTARITEGEVYYALGNAKAATEILKELDSFSKEYTLKSLKSQSQRLRKRISGEHDELRISYFKSLHQNQIKYNERTYGLSKGEPWQKLLQVFLKQKHASKETIIQTLYGRQYNPSKDDSSIYYHIHRLRRQLEQMGLPPRVLQLDKGRYRLNATIETERLEI